MKILALELSSAVGSIALHNDESAVVSHAFPNDRKHSGQFFQHLSELSESIPGVQLIVVGLGPGSYAGSRIAISAALGLKAVNRACLVGLPSICAIESGGDDYQVIGDARRQSFFCARIAMRRCIEGPTLYTEDALREKLKETAAVPLFSSQPLAQFEKAITAYPSARILAELASAQNEDLVSQETLEPIYLREPHITVPKR